MAAPRTSPTAIRRFWLRLLCVAAALLPLALVELALRRHGSPLAADDPYVEFVSVEPLFVRNDTGDRYRTAPNRLAYFRPQSFPTPKPDDAFRIFVLGGSTVQGRPFSVETSFSTWLQLGLESADPSKTWEVVNCGGVSYASYRLAPILEEVLAYDPDCLILCTGHNEFLEERTYAHLRALPSWARSWYRRLARLRTFAAAGSWWNRSTAGGHPTGESEALPTEVQAALDANHALDRYQRDDRRRDRIVEHFAYSIRHMVDRAKQADVPILLISPPADLKDTSPFKAAFSSQGEATASLAERWRIVTTDELSPRREVELLRAIRAEDDRHAGVLFRLGHGLLSAFRPAEAREAFLRAKDEDLVPLRILESMRTLIRDTAEETDTPFLDAHALLESRTPDHILDSTWLVDHVHPTVGGHREIARALVTALEAQAVVTRPPDWEATWERAADRHLRNLNPAYFAKGRQRLERLQRWARGRAGAGQNRAPRDRLEP